MKLYAAAAGMLLLVAPAFAQDPVATTQEVDFGAWCSDIAHYPGDRCAERRPDDQAAYDRYADSVHLFESEKIEKDNARRIETERVNRMGDVTADQIHDSAIGH